MGHFVREYRGPRNQDNRNRNQDSSRRTVNVEETSSKAMVAIDGAGFDWSFMTDEKVPTKMALMAFSDLEIEKLKKEKESNQIKINKFENASKSLDKLIGSQISDNSRKGVGFVSYNFVPPPPTGLFAPPTIDLSNSGLEEFQQPKFEGYGPNTSKSVYKDTSNEVKKTPDALLGEKLVSEKEKQTIFPTKIESVKQQEKPARKPVKLTAITIKWNGWANQVNVVKASACWVWRPTKLNNASISFKRQNYIDARGRSKHMTGNMSYLTNFKEFDGGNVTFRGGAKGGRITSKGTLKISKLDFEDVYFVKGLQFNLFSVSQMCDKKNSVLFTNTTCFVLSPDFKLPNESQVLLKVLRKNNMYNVDMKNIVSKESLTCLVANATLDESMLWHRRLGHINFKTINKLVKDNLVRGLPAKHFENDQIYVACLKGKQHKASCKSKIQNSITQPVFMLHMNLFGPTFMSNLMNKKYCLVVTDDYSRFTWVFFLASKDETSGILKNLHIRFLENKPIVTGTNSNDFAGSKESNGAGHTSKETEFSQDYIVMPLNAEKKDDEGVSKASGFSNQEQPERSTPNINTARPSANFKTGSLNINIVSPKVITTRSNRSQNESDMFSLGRSATLKATHADLFGDEREMDMSNLTTSYQVHTTLNIRIHKDHSLNHVIGDIQSGVQTKGMTKNTNEHGFISAVYEGKTHEDLHTLDLPKGKRAIGTKWIFKNKKDERGIVTRNKERLVVQGYTKEESIDYDEVFAPVARIEAIRLFLAYASFIGFMVYQMDVKSAFLYGIIEEDVYVCNLQDLKILTILTKFTRSASMYFCIKLQEPGMEPWPSLQVKQREDGIFISQDKYVAEILRNFAFTDVRTASTPMDTEKLLLKERNGNSNYTKVSHLHAVKMIFSDYAGASLDRKSTTGGCQFLGCILISWQCKKQIVVATSYTEAEYVVAASCCGQGNNVNMQSRMVRRTCNIKQKYVMNQIPRQIKRGRDTKIPQSSGPPKKVGDEAVHKELGDRMERAATTASSLEAE
ncbi:ribonuclease H-like domain-containing protein [Tanacetum coccineum]